MRAHLWPGPLKVKFGAAVPPINRHGQADGGPVVHLVRGVDGAHLGETLAAVGGGWGRLNGTARAGAGRSKEQLLNPLWRQERSSEQDGQGEGNIKDQQS